MWRAAGEGGEDEWTPSTAEREREAEAEAETVTSRGKVLRVPAATHTYTGVFTHTGTLKAQWPRHLCQACQGRLQRLYAAGQ